MKFIDLFAGVGGIRRGFEKVFKGSEFVFASEIDKFAQKTYEDNYGDKPHGDITKIEPKEIPEFDILLGGFPCQAFSIAGKRKGFEDTRGTLFFNIANITKEHKPQIVFMENVKGLLSHDRGNTFEVIKATMEELGYKVYTKILNAKDFGLPQNRERIFIVCFLDHGINFEFPEIQEIDVKLGDILEEEVDDKYTLSDQLWEGHQRRKREHIRKGNGFGYKMFNKESKYTSTISARYYKDGSEILIEQEGKNPRKLTPREAARLQGFDDEFKITCSNTQAYKQFGNSVAVPVITKIAEKIKEAIDKR